AYAGLLRVASFKDGETVFVSAAAGAVGSIACQLAKARGATVIGSAGTNEKCAWLRDVAKVDAAINYKTTPNLVPALKAAAPKCICVYFDNVGAGHLEAALTVMKQNGRIAVCGMIAQYNEAGPVAGPSNIIVVIPKRLRLQGFIVFDHFDMFPAFQEEVGRL